jgi:predicted transcriptional regulator
MHSGGTQIDAPKDPEQIVAMEIFGKRLRERATQLGISNAETARRIGLDERRYGHYVSGRREPNLMILKRISGRIGHNSKLAARYHQQD